MEIQEKEGSRLPFLFAIIFLVIFIFFFSLPFFADRNGILFKIFYYNPLSYLIFDTFSHSPLFIIFTITNVLPISYLLFTIFSFKVLFKDLYGKRAIKVIFLITYIPLIIGFMYATFAYTSDYFNPYKEIGAGIFIYVAGYAIGLISIILLSVLIITKKPEDSKSKTIFTLILAILVHLTYILFIGWYPLLTGLGHM